MDKSMCLGELDLDDAYFGYHAEEFARTMSLS